MTPGKIGNRSMHVQQGCGSVSHYSLNEVTMRYTTAVVKQLALPHYNTTSIP